jgi:hypothetical protein
VPIGPEPLKRVGAVAAVATGLMMLVRNVKKLRHRRTIRWRRTAMPVL